MSLADETLLILSPIGVPLYSARGLTQTITPIAEAKSTPRYTINGELRWLGLNTMRRYETVITCTDQNAPAFAGLWPGMIVTIDCVCELCYHESGVNERAIIVGSTRLTADGFIYYRPRLECMAIDFDQSTAEYPRDYQWRLVLRERGSG